jgi:DNA-binding MarR family transcriptional regulator
MSEPSAADPFSTFLNTHSRHRTSDMTPTDRNAAGELPDDAWTVLAALDRARAMEIVELRDATRLSMVALVRLLSLLEERGLARGLGDDGGDVAMVTGAGRVALAEHASA